MKLNLLEIGQNTEQLSSCRLSLILGVNTSNNLINTFARVARRLLKTEKCLLGFHKEPYIWYSTASEFWGFETPPELNLLNYLKNKQKSGADYSALITEIEMRIKNDNG